MILHGENVLIQVVAGHEGYAPFIAAAKSCTVHVETDIIEVSDSSQYEWKKYVANRKSWSITIDHLVMSSTFLNSITQVGTEVEIYVTVSIGNNTERMSGRAIIKDWDAKASVGSLVNGTFKLIGTSGLSSNT